MNRPQNVWKKKSLHFWIPKPNIIVRKRQGRSIKGWSTELIAEYGVTVSWKIYAFGSVWGKKQGWGIQAPWKTGMFMLGWPRTPSLCCLFVCSLADLLVWCRCQQDSDIKAIWRQTRQHRYQQLIEFRSQFPSRPMNKERRERKDAEAWLRSIHCPLPCSQSICT